MIRPPAVEHEVVPIPGGPGLPTVYVPTGRARKRQWVYYPRTPRDRLTRPDPVPWPFAAPTPPKPR